jgi:hypothetical protein
MKTSNEKAAPAGAAFVDKSHENTTNNAPKIQVINSNVEAMQSALLLADKGIPCFPCLASKAPACPNGFKAATTHAERLTSLWKRYPAPLIGVATGATSGIDVLDIDPRHNGDKWLSENAARLPISRIHHTRSGGWHILFKHRAGIRNSANKIAPGVDVRGDGGYVIWWPATEQEASAPTIYNFISH